MSNTTKKIIIPHPLADLLKGDAKWRKINEDSEWRAVVEPNFAGEYRVTCLVSDKRRVFERDIICTDPDYDGHANNALLFFSESNIAHIKKCQQTVINADADHIAFSGHDSEVDFMCYGSDEQVDLKDIHVYADSVRPFGKIHQRGNLVFKTDGVEIDELTKTHLESSLMNFDQLIASDYAVIVDMDFGDKTDFRTGEDIEATFSCSPPEKADNHDKAVTDAMDNESLALYYW